MCIGGTTTLTVRGDDATAVEVYSQPSVDAIFLIALPPRVHVSEHETAFSKGPYGTAIDLAVHDPFGMNFSRKTDMATARTTGIKNMASKGRAGMAGNEEENELHKLLHDQLADIYYAEKKLLKALPKMAKATKHEELSTAFTDHARETEQHVERLEKAFDALGKKAKGKKCEAMEGLLDEANSIKSEFKQSRALDAALIAAAQKVEHYEIASYGSMVAWCDQLGLGKVGKLLQQNLDEEKQADDNLTSIAESYVNKDAE